MYKANALDQRNGHLSKGEEKKTVSKSIGNGGPIAMKAFDYKGETLGVTQSIAVDHKINKEL